MTREEFNKNSYLVNNNALYNKHTEHISTTEPLYLDGMDGSDNLIHKKSVDDGSDTPELQTLFAYEEEPNQFIIGEFKRDTLRIQTQGNSNIVWLSSETGVINGTMSLSAPALEKILQAVNEKYGTSFEGWSQLPTVYEVGDTVPNWNAYERVYLPETKVKFNMPGSTTMFAMGKIVGNNFSLIGDSNDQFYWVEASGVISYLSGDASDFASSYCKQMLVSAGYNILTTNVEIKVYEVGDSVEDWQNYIFVS